MNRQSFQQTRYRWSNTFQQCTASVAKIIYTWRTPPQPPQILSPIHVVCISDTHTTEPQLPDGDLLLHAGDLSQNGSFHEIQAQLDWLNAQPHKHKVLIAGNHDLLLDPVFVDRFPERIFERPGSSRSNLRWGDIIYLQDDSVELDFDNGRKLKIYGAPSTQQFGNWAFQYPPIRDVWTGIIPRDTDILLTHGPPKGYLDAHSLGSEYLLRELGRTKPQLVVFGHIHAGYGQAEVTFDDFQIAYDDILHGNKGIWTLLKMLVHLLFDKGMFKPGRYSTKLVNAAIVGQNNEVRSPIIVSV